MTPSTAANIRARAERQVHNGYCHAHITAGQLAALAGAYLDALERLHEIGELAQVALEEWSDHHRAEEREKLKEIVRLCND